MRREALITLALMLLFVFIAWFYLVVDWVFGNILHVDSPWWVDLALALILAMFTLRIEIRGEY